MSRLVNFIEGARGILTPKEWLFFQAVFVDGKDVVESAKAAETSGQNAGALREDVLRKLRGVVAVSAVS